MCSAINAKDAVAKKHSGATFGKHGHRQEHIAHYGRKGKAMSNLNMHRPLKAVRLYDSGLTKSEIARRMETRPNTVAEWIDCFEYNMFGLSREDIKFLAEKAGIKGEK